MLVFDAKRTDVGDVAITVAAVAVAGDGELYDWG